MGVYFSFLYLFVYLFICLLKDTFLNPYLNLMNCRVEYLMLWILSMLNVCIYMHIKINECFLNFCCLLSISVLYYFISKSL